MRIELTVLLLLSACAAGTGGSGPYDAPGGDNPRPPPGDPIGSDQVPNQLLAAPDERTVASAERYLTMCSACHGDWGEGSSAPSLWNTRFDRDALITKIEQTMPPKDPTLCDRTCAEGVADLVMSRMAGDALTCQGMVPSPRQLRVLNRREYANTVRTLFASPAVASPCSHTFRFDPGETVTAVFVAGTFNEWSESAWPMQRDGSGTGYSLVKELGAGAFEFKYVVVRESGTTWVPDPTLPATGEHQNSRLTLTCGDASPLDLGSLPAETRPQAYPFDTSISSVIGGSQFEAYYALAKQIAARIPAPEALAACALDTDRETCGRQLVLSLGRRVFRRPLSTQEVGRYLTLVTRASEPAEAVRTLVTALLSSPNFLYRTELGVAQPDGTFLLTPHELASALSYLLTANMPDDALMDAADRGELETREQLLAHAERLLDSPQARGAAGDFVLQWLGVSNAAALARDLEAFPEFTPSVAEAMLRETRTFAEYVMFEGTGTMRELLTADYTFADAELAAFYGHPGTFDATMRKVPLTDAGRAGVLGHASVLATYAHANQSSPVLRGLFVRRQLMCQRFGEPPPNAGTVPAPDPTLSTRERFDMHAQTACASCHQHIDPLGFGFEHYDAIGRFRAMDGPHEVDAQGAVSGVDSLHDGTSTPFDSPRALALELAESPAVDRCVAKQSYRFTRGALDSALQYCAMRFVTQRYRQNGGTLRAALLATIEAVDFRYRY